MSMFSVPSPLLLSALLLLLLVLLGPVQGAKAPMVDKHESCEFWASIE